MQYKTYRDKALVSNNDNLLKLDESFVVELQKEWDAVEAENALLRKQNVEAYNAKLEEVEKYITSLGIKLFKYDRKGRKVYEKWFSNIAQPLQYKIVGYGVEYKPASNLPETYRQAKKTAEYIKNVFIKKDRLIVESLKKANEFGLNSDGLSIDDIIYKVDELAKEKEMSEKFPAGTVIDLDDNHCECGVYTIGERRCSCGNRRISAYIEGDIVNGYYLTTEPY